jgi:outer membrane protein TolC
LAVAQLNRAQVLWLPTIYLGADYFRHDGEIQSVQGDVFGTSKSGFMAGCGPSAVFAITDAIFEPLAARQVVRSREATLQAARNDSMLGVAEAYFNVQQAVGELIGALVAAKQAENLIGIVKKLAPGLIPDYEVARTRAEAARRQQIVHQARLRWRTASAELARLLRLEPSILVQPLEPPQLRVTFFTGEQEVDDLIPVALTNRPELAAQQALVQATLQHLRQERLRPLLPSLLLRGASTPVTGTLAAGTFGGGLNESISHFSMRSDFDLQLIWEFQNLGFGNHARVNERRAENRLAVLELFRTQDRIAAEVATAYAEAQSAAVRLAEAESELKSATESAKRNFEGLEHTRPTPKAEDKIVLVVRPQEAVAAIQALGQAYNDYYGVVADYNRAQFRLYRALGQPAQMLTGEGDSCSNPAVENLSPSPLTVVHKPADVPVIRQTSHQSGEENGTTIILYRPDPPR